MFKFTIEAHTVNDAKAHLQSLLSSLSGGATTEDKPKPAAKKAAPKAEAKKAEPQTETVEEPEVNEVADNSGISRDGLKEKCNEVLKTYGGDGPILVAEAFKQVGAAKFGEVADDKLEECANALDKAVAAHEKAQG